MISLKLKMRGVPSPRPRVTRYGTYMTPTYTKYKKALQAKYSGFSMLPNVPLELDLLFVFKTPKNGIKRNKYKLPRSDCDNLAKGVMDSMNKVLFEDDVMIQKLTVKKMYGLEDMIFINLKEL